MADLTDSEITELQSLARRILQIVEVSADVPEPEFCLQCGQALQKGATSRLLCRRCYSRTMQRIARGTETEDELVSAGLLAPRSLAGSGRTPQTPTALDKYIGGKRSKGINQEEEAGDNEASLAVSPRVRSFKVYRGVDILGRSERLVIDPVLRVLPGEDTTLIVEVAIDVDPSHVGRKLNCPFSQVAGGFAHRLMASGDLSIDQPGRSTITDEVIIQFPRNGTFRVDLVDADGTFGPAGGKLGAFEFDVELAAEPKRRRKKKA